MSSVATVFNQQNKPKNRFKGKLRDIDTFTLVEGSYLVKNWLPKGKTLSVFYGPPSVGKSFFALDMCCHIAAGVSWYGNRVTQGYVTYICSEGGGLFGNRVIALAKGKQEIHRKAVGHLRILTENVNFYKDTIDLNHFIEEHRDVPPDLVVIDTVAMAMSGADENTSRDMGKFVENMKKIGDGLNCQMLGIHHTGKEGERGMRGSNALPASADTVLCLEKTDDVVRVTPEKQRDLSTDFEFNYSLKKIVLGIDKDGEDITSCVVERAGPKLGDAQQKIANLLVAGPQRNKDICEILGMEKSNVSRDIAKLKKRKVVYEIEKSYHLNREVYTTMIT